MKLLWLLVFLLIVIWLFHGKKASVRRDKATAAGHATHMSEHAERIVQCMHCGVHVPASEAVQSSSGAVFCSQEHRLAHVGS